MAHQDQTIAPESAVGSPTIDRLTVGPEGAGERLDKWLAAALPALSRARIQQIAASGGITIDAVVERSAARRLKPGSVLEVTRPIAAPAAPQAQAIDLVIVHEDDDLLVIDKPAGMVVHPAAGHADGTLVNALIAHCGDSLSGIGGVKRPGIVHRLDKDTSGLMVVAKTDRAHRGLAAQFADHGRTGPLERAYLAVVWGVPQPRSGTIDAPLDRSPVNREKIAVAKPGKGRAAITHYETITCYGPGAAPWASLIRCRLETGRTHQIRVHLAHRGHPLLGDATYGAGYRTKASRLPDRARSALLALDRQALHAAVLGFAHPVTGTTLRFETAAPADLRALMDALHAAA